MIKRALYMVFIFAFLCAGPVYTQEAAPAPETISLDFKGMDVVDVLKLIAQRGNINIAISKNVRGKVTMFLKDVKIYDAFEIILASNELAYEKSGNILNVMTEKDYEKRYGYPFRDKRSVETLALKYANASDVSKSITQIKTKIGKVIVDEAANSIVMMDSPEALSKAKGIILALDKPTETRVFSLDYAKAEEVKSKLEERLTKNIGSVQVDERTNKIIITELSSRMPEIESLINEYDEKTREVLIEAKILEITLNDEFRWGVNWDRVFKLASKVAGMSVGANFADAIAGTILPAETGSVIGGSLEIGSLTGHDYHVMLEVLDRMGRTEVLSSPRIVVINNEEASILVGTNQPYATTGTTVSDTVSQTTQQVTYVDLGVKLHVTPTINKNGFITMKINPEVSSKTDDYTIVSEEGTTTRTTTVPVISTSEAETTVMVKDGNIIVLAGLIEKRNEEDVNSIPFISKIPVLGNLFKSRQRGSVDNPERKELVIFITPHIISGEVKSPEVDEYLTTTEVGKAEVVHPKKRLEKTRFLRVGNNEPKIGLRAKREISVSPNQAADNVSELSPAAYYRLVRGKVMNTVKQSYPRSGIVGDVYVSFDISSSGVLVGEPRILKPADKTLEKLAIKSVKASAPFPRFPDSITDPVETFKLIISYK